MMGNYWTPIDTLASDCLKEGRPSAAPRLQELSPVRLEEQTHYEGPTRLDQAIVSGWRPERRTPGFGAQLQDALTGRARWLAERGVAHSAPGGSARAEPHMMHTLRRKETDGIVQDLSQRLNATFVATPPGNRTSGTYDHSITTPTGRIAVIRREDTFTLGPWKSALEPMRGRLVIRLRRSQPRIGSRP
jgi:hypothetical protein